jgi:copper chaperone
MATATTYDVQGMTCGHCVNAVTEELQSVEGVTAVEVAPVDEAAVRAAVDEAGYQVV